MGALLIGDFNSATDAEIIKLHNIKTIITAAVGMEHLQVPANVAHIIYPLLDANSENIKRFFDESTITIKNSNNMIIIGLKNGGVLVHCAAGISRVIF
jgi:protein-tyrosine phosphatase